MPASKSLREKDNMDLAGMMTMEEAAGDSVKVIVNCSEGMTGSWCRVNDVVAGCNGVLHVDYAFLVEKKEDIFDSDRSKWRTYSSKRYGESYTWYGESGATKRMSNTRRDMPKCKPCQGMNVLTASN